MQKYVMVIDLQRCVGCGACSVACKNENNLSDGFLWSSKITETTGTFPNVQYQYVPTLCNHCAKAPCVTGCPTRAMHKLENGITMHDAKKCIGCRYCMFNCPYGVIYFNWQRPHAFWKEDTPVIEGCTAPPLEVVHETRGNTLPYYNRDRQRTYRGIRPKGVVEKCTFCDHRVSRGKLPDCVLACPADARMFGDLKDPESQVTHLLKKYRPIRRKDHLGTEPSVFYIRNYNPALDQTMKGDV